MSTIEEAREQAREALAQWDAPGGNHSGQVIGFLASALRALLDATEPPAQAEPAEDEREALIERIAGTIAVPWLVSHGTTWGDLVQRSRDPYMRDAREVLRVVEAAGYSKGPRPITDEMVERAISAHRFTNAFGPEEVTRMRAALEEVEEARR